MVYLYHFPAQGFKEHGKESNHPSRRTEAYYYLQLWGAGGEVKGIERVLSFKAEIFLLKTNAFYRAEELGFKKWRKGGEGIQLRSYTEPYGNERPSNCPNGLWGSCGN